MKSKLLELLEYNFDSNQKLIHTSLEYLGQLDEKTILVLNHILNANQVWNARILNETVFGVWQINDEKEWLSINESNYQKSQYVLNSFDLKEILIYKNSQGTEFQNSIEDVLFHIINHSTYHRGQIAMRFRESDLNPLISDYIVYKRN